MGCRKMDYFAFLLARQAGVRELSAVHSDIVAGLVPCLSRISLIVEKAESMRR
jgi:hypothetical protein